MRLIALFVILVAATVVACGGSPTGPGSSGSLRVMLKDSPFTEAKSLLVTFSEVSVHKADEAADSWKKLAFSGSASSRTCDLMKLRTAQDVLGVGAIDTGHYTQIRLMVTSSTIHFDNAAAGNACDTTIAAPSGRSAPLEIPSGEVKLNREFDVSSNNTTSILLDFDGD